jgi:hypothetical protein
MEDNSMNRASHPAYSSDLASSDFHLFGYLKQMQADIAFDDRAFLFIAMESFWAALKVTSEKCFWELDGEAGEMYPSWW